jgi:uncharacterized protein (TIGR03437 family)
MARKAKVIVVTVLLAGLYCTRVLGQSPTWSILEVDIENLVEYQGDIFDSSKFAINPDVTPSAGAKEFTAGIVIGDIVAVNGQPAKGTVVGHPMGIGLAPVFNPGHGAIADTTRISVGYRSFEILRIDGTPVGTIVALGLNGGTSPPGPPFGGQNFAIVGGTGAFLGARGQQGGRQTPQTIPPRAASMAEDPARRRINGGGRVRWLLAVIPMSAPQIVATPLGPNITHSSDFSLVTASRPAASGEMLSAFLTGLGPTAPGVDVGKPFPASPLATANSPVDVTVNGKSAEVLAAVGVPGSVDTYMVNFRVPPETARGAALVQVSAAWIAGPVVAISIQ